MTYDFKKSLTFDVDGKLNPGEWGKTEHSAMISCPKCTHFGDLKQHTIHDDGIVEPSVLHEYPIADLDGSNPREGCGFHEMIKLLDWIP